MTNVRLLWLQDDPGVSLQPLMAGLTEAERQELAGFANAGRQRHFILTRSLLRRTLARQLDKPADTIHFRRADSGRLLPAADDGIHFSLSHSRNRVAVALAASPCGVDIEHAHAIDTLRIAERYFAAPETAWLRTRDTTEMQRDFFRLWTLKEAAVKALGQGLATNLSRLAFALEENGPRLLDDTPGLQCWQRQEEDFFLAAAVVSEGEVDWQCREIELDELLRASF